ncbi:MAG: nucleotidyl transferase AbiEii/AbiGii toxin family protein [Atopobiaceae bacterium]
MQLKALINNRAKAARVSPQLMLQNYMLERLVDRLAHSRWQSSVIIKGGMLIGSLIGVDKRTTKDLDTTVMGFGLNHESAQLVFSEVCSIDLDDDIKFELLRTEDIRETDDYPGIRAFLKARYDPLDVPLSIDVTTGDAITPGAVLYEYPFVFDEGHAAVMAYPLETVLAEKAETVLARNIKNNAHA